MDDKGNKVNDVSKITDNQNCIGGVKKHHSQKSRREKKVEEYDDETIKMQKQIAKDLEVKYGRGSIDMDSGTFTPFS